MNDFTLAAISLILMVCLALIVIRTFWRLVSPAEPLSPEESRSIAAGMALGLLLGTLLGLAVGWMVLDNLLLGISLGAGSGLSLGVGLVILPSKGHGDKY